MLNRFKTLRMTHMFLISFFSFMAGAATVLALQPHNFTEEMSPATLQDESARPPFWEADETENDPLDLNLEVLNIDPEKSPEITNETVDNILSDYEHRISPDFQIPDLIFNQTKFWFRVYTEFDSTKKIIHDSLHPQIIYDVVDVSDILAQPARAAWLNNVKAQKAVSKRVSEIRRKLKKMARMNPKDMDDEEKGWLQQFDEIKGSRKKIILTAARSMRVQTGQKDFFERGLSISSRYLDGMETIFKQKNLPIELTRLPFVESSFVIGATSKVGAAGIWQFMPGVGRQFMIVNSRMDERRNPWKATEAAAKLLKENYTILHKSWGLALTAYNHGPAGVRLAMKKLGTRDIAKIVRSYRSRNFDFASANFYTCFLAALHAQMYKDVLWSDHIYEPSLSYEVVKVKKSLHSQKLAEMMGLSAEQFLLYNPELDRSFKKNDLIPRGYRLFIPSEEKESIQKTVALRSNSIVIQ